MEVKESAKAIHNDQWAGILAELAELRRIFHERIGRIESIFAQAAANTDGHADLPADLKAPLLDHENFSIVYQGRICQFRPGQLTWRLAERLFRRPGFPVSVRSLRTDVWEDELVGDGAIRRKVSELRATLRNAGLGDLAEGIHGRDGYYWAPASQKVTQK